MKEAALKKACGNFGTFSWMIIKQVKFIPDVLVLQNKTGEFKRFAYNGTAFTD